jgi:hypothetical protein
VNSFKALYRGAIHYRLKLELALKKYNSGLDISDNEYLYSYDRQYGRKGLPTV